MSVWADTFFSVRVTDGTILFFPSALPAASQPLVTTFTCTAFATSTGAPHAVVIAIAQNQQHPFHVAPTG